MKKALVMLSLALIAPRAWCGGEEDEKSIVNTTLSAVREKSDAFRNVPVRFTVQFNSLGKISNPFFTRFVPTEFVNFYAWASDQPIWRKESYDDLFGMLFLSKESKFLPALYTLKLYDRVELVATVRNTFQGTPWIEVLSFKPVAGKVTTATLAHLFRGEQLMNQRQWELAVQELSLAPGSATTDEIRAAVHKDLGICYLRTGEASKAAAQLHAAISANGGTDPECQRLLDQALLRPEGGLDRVARDSGQPVKEVERPLWEAFEGVQPAQNQGTSNGTPARPSPAPGGAATDVPNNKSGR
jgi:hypothetical protein